MTLIKILSKELETEPDILGHGGKRKGAGRPRKEKTKVIRVPVSKLSAIKAILNERTL